MIINCEKCDTRFRVDDARIPAQGARVRCSRCKHAFHVLRPDADDDDAIEEVVAQATDPGAPAAPEPTRDLPGPGGELEEQDWEFNLDPPRGQAAEAEPPASAHAADEAPGLELATESPLDLGGADDESPLGELGSPTDWDFLGDAAERPAAPEAAAPPPAAEAAEPADATPADDPGAEWDVDDWEVDEPDPPAAAPAAPAPEAASVATEARPARGAPSAPKAARPRPGKPWIAPAAGPFAVAVVAVLLVGAVGLALRAPPASIAPREAPIRFELAFGEATGVTARSVENALAGPLLVVTGDLEVRRRAPRSIEVRWVDATGQRVGVGAIAGTPLIEGKLRERPPEALQRELASRADGLARGGAFQAILGPRPPEAVRYEVVASDAALPRPKPAVEPPEAEAEPATASRPPSPLPSSE